MATTQYGVNHPMAVKLWAKKLAVEALRATSFGQYVGEDAASLIHLKTETQKGPGDQITFGLRMQLDGRGVQGTDTLEGNEEALSIFTDAVVINKVRHAVRSGSANSISQQRVPFDIRQEALDGLVDWWANRMDVSMFNQLCGYTPESDTIFTGNQAVTAPDTAHHIWADDTDPSTNSADEDLVAADVFTLDLINLARAKATKLSPPIRPLKIGGRNWYVLFLHPDQVYDLKADATNAGNWFSIQQAAMQGGKITDNPIFTGALGVYNNTILVENSRITQGVNSGTGAAIANTRRAVFCGAQAAAVAYGQDNGPDRYRWVEEFFDYTEQLGVASGAIYGIKSTRFNSADYGKIVVSSYAEDR